MRILVFSAHPDDAEFSIGGTLVKLAKRNDLTLCVMTDGGAGTYGDAEMRKKEQQGAAKLLGADLIWKGLPDCSLEHDRKHVLMVAQIIRGAEPDVVLAPYWKQGGDLFDGIAHPEHRILGNLVRDGARYARFRIADLSGAPHRVSQLYYFMAPQESCRIGIPVEREDCVRVFNTHKSQTQLKDGGLIEHLLSNRAAAASNHPGTELVETLTADKPILISDLAALGLAN